MEPLSIVAISAAVGGAAAKLVDKAWDSGEKWLSTYFKDHHPKAIERAQNNSLAFLAELAQRVRRLENAASDSGPLRQRITSALQDPGFSALLKDALLGSARTENENTRKIMARIVSERLCCKPESLLAVLIRRGCEAVTFLTTSQLRLLAVGAIIHGVFPRKALKTEPTNLNGWCVNWLTENLPLVLPQHKRSYYIDLLHMTGMCVNLREGKWGGGLTDYWEICYEFLIDAPHEELSNFLKTDQLGKQFYHCWEEGFRNTALTPTGQLVGLCVYDELTGDQTDLEPYFQ